MLMETGVEMEEEEDEEDCHATEGCTRAYC